MAGPQHKEDRMESRRRRKVVAPGKTHANAVEDDSSYHRQNSCSMP